LVFNGIKVDFCTNSKVWYIEAYPFMPFVLVMFMLAGIQPISAMVNLVTGHWISFCWLAPRIQSLNLTRLILGNMHGASSYFIVLNRILFMNIQW